MIEVEVRSIRREAPAILRLELGRLGGGPLPAFTAGAHIDLCLPNGTIRQYSVCNGPGDLDVYEVGILKDPASRGGSLYLHETVKVGDVLRIGAPRNLFPLVTDARRHLLFAGGIGITPILSMARHLAAAKAEFVLHYSARSRVQAGFLGALEALDLGARLQLHFDDRPDTALDPAMALGAPEPEKHVYVCGPAGLIAHIFGHARAAGWRDGNLHRESFGAEPSSLANESFTVRLAKSGRMIAVSPNQSVTQALEAEGIVIPVSCEQGVCGTCLTRVVEGEPEHRDQFLTDEERAANDLFLPCCSRSRTQVLVLDL